jgi:hypothetical protein
LHYKREIVKDWVTGEIKWVWTLRDKMVKK